MKSIKTGKILIAFVAIFAIMIMAAYVKADTLNATVCCEKTNSGLYCQNVPQSECSTSGRSVPTSCDSTSFCKPGVCYNSAQGTCLDNTPEIVCNANGGTWSANSPPQCSLGCCVLGDQAAFVTLTRCKFLSSSLGLQTNYNKGITNEVQCVMQVQSQDKGACVYESEFERTCKFTTRDECSSSSNSTTLRGQFFKDKLCSSEELGTNCAPTSKTTCAPGKDEVYFVDSCGNPANIYDSSMVPRGNRTDAAFLDYWANVKSKAQSCNANSQDGSANSKTCGNCNYLAGSICRASSSAGTKASYGDYICADLNCPDTSAGPKKHGESWCVFTDAGKTGTGSDSVGSRFYKHICENGQEVLEQCADFRQEECIQSAITTTQGTFSQAACRVNRWRDCSAQTTQQDCVNTDQRDCLWQADITNPKTSAKGVCIPANPPGLQFWAGNNTKQICAQADTQCKVTFEKGLFGGESCKENCDCLTDTWQKQQIQLCQSYGDCGPQINWVGDKGYKQGYTLTKG